MSTIYDREFVCSVCGSAKEYLVIGSTNTMGSSDLDTRPAEMQRSTMQHWVQVCPNCGYAASAVSEPLACEREFLESDEYKLFPLSEPNSRLTKAFIWAARIDENSQKYASAFWDYLHAAWSADDDNDQYWSKQARLFALTQYDKLGKADRTDNLILIRADLLRKTEQFDRLLSEYKGVRFKAGKNNEDNILNKIIAFQLQKAKIRNTATFTVSSAEEIDLKKYCTQHEKQAAILK